MVYAYARRPDYGSDDPRVAAVVKERLSCGLSLASLSMPRRPSGPMSTIAWSHHMAGDAWPSLELRRVMLNEVSSRMPEIPPRNTPQARRHLIKFIVILLRSR